MSAEATLRRARERAEEGERVRVLVCAPRGRGQALAQRLWREGISPDWLEDGPVPEALRARPVEGEHGPDWSDRVRHALEGLHRQHGLDEVEVPVLGGLGFRAVQAQRCGVGLAGVTLVARLDTCSSWERLQQGLWPDGAEALRVEHMERYSFERAGARLAPREDVREYVRSLGWSVGGLPGEAPAANGGCEPSTGGGRACGEGRAGPPVVTVCVPHYNLGAYLPAALDSLEQQTYRALEVIVIDDGSTDAGSVEVFEAMRARHPSFRFVRQANAGIGATRNWGLREARGEYFLPVDADNVARPDMVERFVAAMGRRPDAAALTCYFLAFEQDEDIDAGRFAFGCRPTGGPHVLACLRNVYGDANAIFRTEALCAVGGYEADRGTSYEDWELFVKLVNGGHAVDVLPEALFYYRHRPGGFSRVTDAFANQMRVLRQFGEADRLPPAERALLWQALVGAQLRAEHQEACLRSRRHRLADGVYQLGRLAARGLRALAGAGARPGR